tara:strand:- start:36005 stop:37042 length:1038 start_codon:yes stop_codon:yes gene_type:complete
MEDKKALGQCLLLDGVVFTFLILSFAVAILQPTEEQLLNLSMVSGVTFGTLIVTMALAYGLIHFKIKTVGYLLFSPPKIDDSAHHVSWFKTFWGVQLTVAFVVACIVGIRVTDFSLYELFDEQGMMGARRIFSSLFTPNFDILPRAVLAIVETIFMAFMATVLAVPVAFVLSFLCAKNIMGDHPVAFALYGTLRTVLNVTRSIEPLIWAIVFSVWVGIGPFAGMLALLLHSVASLAKNFSELAEGISEGPIEAIRATGATPVQVVWFAVVPQIVLPYTAFTIYRWDINVRMATIIGLVGGGGIGTMLIQYQGQAQWNEVGCLVIVIAVVVWLMDTASAYIREAIK